MNIINKDYSSSDILILLFFIIIFKISFFFSGFILEDSFIVFRSAFNLADYGKFSYNLDELNSATTSKIFGLICAGFRVIFKEYAILSIIAFNNFVSFLSSLLIFFSIKNLFSNNNFSKEMFYFIGVIIFLNPSISQIGIVGLEFSILVFFISLVFFAISTNSKKILCMALFIPFIRVELIGFILIVSFSYLYFQKFKHFFILIFAGLVGVLLNGYLNFIYDGYFFPGPAVSKWNSLSSADAFSLNRVLDDLHFWFIGSRSFFLGIYSKFIPNIFLLSFAVMILILSVVNFRFLNFKKYNNIDKKIKIFLLSISGSIIFLPLSYVLGGHIWDWYLYPYSFLSYTILAIFIINLTNFKKLFLPLIIIIFFANLLQFAVLKNIGFQENSYRSVIGKDIFKLSDSPASDTLFLEPAGYVPFYAKIKTFDTVGLSSPEILKYRKMENNQRWWLDFIEHKNPTFVLDRSDLYGGYSHDGIYGMTDSELLWFKKNYKLIKKYNYHEYVSKYAGSLEYFYKLGSHSDFYLYKKNN